MSKNDYRSFTAADYELLAEQLRNGETAILPGMKGTPALDFADALARLGNQIGDMPIKMETIGDDLHVSRKVAA